jgi:hypothetical protein
MYGKWYKDITNIDVIVHNQKLIMFTGVVEVGMSAVVRITGAKGWTLVSRTSKSSES